VMGECVFLKWYPLKWVLSTLTCEENAARRFVTSDFDFFCLLWIDEATPKDKIYIWVSVWWKTKNWRWGIYTSRIHLVARGTGTPKDRDEVVYY
jgi:hypothetical protein